MKTTKYKIDSFIGATGDQYGEYFTDEQWKEHYRKQQELIDSGEYGKPLTYEVEIIHSHLYDDRTLFSRVPGVESFRMEMMDFGRDTSITEWKPMDATI